MLVTPTLIFEFFALSISLVSFKKLYNSKFILLVPLLLLTLFVEVFAVFIYKFTKSSHWIHNFFIGVEIVIFFYFFYFFVKSIKMKRRSILFVCLFVLFFGINILFFQKMLMFNYYSLLFGSILLVINACFFIMELMKINILNIFKNPMFWLASGVLFFFSITTIFFSLFDYLVVSKKVNVSTLYRILITFANFVLYSCLSISILLFWKKKPSF
jgi:hypothetical protein